MSEFTQNSDLAEMGVTEVFGETKAKKKAKKEEVAKVETKPVEVDETTNVAEK
jgi:hypothetical protein